MVEFETIQQEEIKFSKGLLIVAAKKVIGDNGDETKFVQISKADSNGRFRQTLTIPIDMQVVNELARALQTVV